VAAAFDRDQLLAALDDIGRAAVAADARLDIAIYGGSALMLAGNFRYATEDVDIAAIEHPWPNWLTDAVGTIAYRNGWSDQWLNDSVTFHLSPLAGAYDLVPFGTFPRGGARVGLTIFVPTARYLLALKLKALRISDFAKGSKDMDDIASLLRVLAIGGIDDAIAILAEYFPRTAADADKQRFVLRRILSTTDDTHAPRYPGRSD
jgi:hypothetical protein